MSVSGPYRERVRVCNRHGSYKYFFPREQVFAVWDRLRKHYGEICRNENFKTIEIDCEKFIFRSTVLANPITVIRKRGCSSEDVREFHSLVGFVEWEQDA